MKKTQTKSFRHPWRICELGFHWVKEHKRTNAQGASYAVIGHCRKGSSGKDFLYPDEIAEIVKRHFNNLKAMPCPKMFEFKNRENVDLYIAGWTQYWNEVFNPVEKLDPDFVKALIASESSFINRPPVVFNSRKEKVTGLMQITDTSIAALKGAKKEMRDYFVPVSRKSLMDKNLNICAGIRWLFHKKQLAERNAKVEISWMGALKIYKGLKNKEPEETDRVLRNFNENYEIFSKCQ